MGDPKRPRKKYKKPKKLWDKQRINEEKKLKHEYGLKNMRELWVMQQELRRVRREVRKLLALPEEEQIIEAKRIMNKLDRLNILPSSASIDDVLSLNVRNFLERRLQTLVWRKGLAKTPKQARQLIVHGFISIDGRRVTSPSQLITKDIENKIEYYKKIDLEPKIKEVEENKENISKEVEEKMEEKVNENEEKSNN